MACYQPFMERIVVVGGSLAGLRSVEFLRRKGFGGQVVVVGAEAHLPYDRPPLSKEILRGEWTREQLALRKKGYEDLAVEFRLGQAAVGLDTRARRLELQDRERLAYDGLVIATGAQVRRLRGQPVLEGVYTLRTLEDALSIRNALEAGPRVVVIGAGFIGAEVAASCRQLGLSVTMIEALQVPFVPSLGETVGRAVVDIHRKHGVDVRLGVGVERLEGTERVERVLLADGSSVECDLVVVGIGVTPAVGWLESSGLRLGDGVECDETCAASALGIVAAGDVCSWVNPLFQERMRVEHWTNAVEQARHAVDTLLAAPGEAKPFESAPMFWSDQYDVKIQSAGRPKPGDDLHICHGSLESERFVALYGRGGRLVGVAAFNQPAKLFQYRRMITERVSWQDALTSTHP